LRQADKRLGYSHLGHARMTGAKNGTVNQHEIAPTTSRGGGQNLTGRWVMRLILWDIY